MTLAGTFLGLICEVTAKGNGRRKRDVSRIESCTEERRLHKSRGRFFLKNIRMKNVSSIVERKAVEFIYLIDDFSVHSK